MTIKQMADIAGVSPATIRRVGIDLFPGKFENGKKTVFNQSEAIEVMKSVRKKNFVTPLQNEEVLQRSAEGAIQNEKVPTQNGEAPQHTMEVRSSLTPRDIELITSIVSQVISHLSIRTSTNGAWMRRSPQLPSSTTSARKRISMIINSYCSWYSCSRSIAYQQLYKEFEIRFQSNVISRAKRQGIRIIDLIERDGMLSELLSISKEISFF